MKCSSAFPHFITVRQPVWRHTPISRAVFSNAFSTHRNQILRDPLLFPGEVSPSARSIPTGLLKRDLAQRQGVNGAEDTFFKKIISWRRLAQKIQPSFKLSVRSPVDMSDFDTVFTTEQPLDSVIEGSPLSQTVQAQFEGASPGYSRSIILTCFSFTGFSYNARGLTAHADMVPWLRVFLPLFPSTLSRFRLPGPRHTFVTYLSQHQNHHRNRQPPSQ